MDTECLTADEGCYGKSNNGPWKCLAILMTLKISLVY